MSVIIRTAGIGKSKEISKDLTFLVSQWNKIRTLTLKSEAPNLFMKKVVSKKNNQRYANEEVDEVLVEGKDGYDKIKKISKNILKSIQKN